MDEEIDPEMDETIEHAGGDNEVLSIVTPLFKPCNKSEYERSGFPRLELNQPVAPSLSSQLGQRSRIEASRELLHGVSGQYRR